MSRADLPMTPDSDYDFPALMRSRICGYDGAGHDHGHTDCWLFGEGAALIESQADEIKRLRAENRRLVPLAHSLDHRLIGALCTGCDWRYERGTFSERTAAHAAHVDALLNQKETQ